ncbi:MAG: hypothetical protein M1832_005420 [Thelocarpon impressellum]|nr:MAG: hypothetical protein M1832_005420 [Thelocarpon impressellum]
MAPILHCVRHAQGYHNLSVANHTMPDPDLTPFGKEQCKILAETFPHHDRVELLVASPLRRTLYTALLGFEAEVKRGMQVIALPNVQETADVPCDTGSPPEKLREEFKGQPVDLSRVTDGWDSKQGEWAPTAQAIQRRARLARQWLRARPEKEIVLVTHGGFLHYITEDWTDSNKFQGTGWANVEFRSFAFADGDDDSASLVETAESRQRRRGAETPMGATERMEFFETH